jgi:putative membrane protein
VIDILIRIAINAVALIVAVKLVPHVSFTGDWLQLLGVAAVFGVVNAFLRPIVKLLALPLTIITLGLIGFVINAGMILVTAFAGDKIGFGFTLAGWPTSGNINLEVLIAAFLTALVVSVVSTLVGLVRRITPGV